MIEGFKDLLASERGVFCILALIFATALAVIGKLSSESWLEFVKWLTVSLVASKTVTTAIETVRKPQAPSPPSPVDLPVARVVE